MRNKKAIIFAVCWFGTAPYLIPLGSVPPCGSVNAHFRSTAPVLIGYENTDNNAETDDGVLPAPAEPVRNTDTDTDTEETEKTADTNPDTVDTTDGTTDANAGAEDKTPADTAADTADTDSAADENQPADAQYASIADGYVLVGDGDCWYYEKHDNEGRILFKKWFKNDTAVRTHLFTYTDGVLSESTDKSEDRTIVYSYDKESREIKSIETKNGVIKTTEKKYNAQNKIIEIKITEGHNTTLQKNFYTEDGKLKSEEHYINGLLAAKILYNGKNKTVSVYAAGKKIKEFVESAE